MSRTLRTPRPWDYRWRTREDFEAHRRWCALGGWPFTQIDKPWKNHNLSWGTARQFELRLAHRHLRASTCLAMTRQLAFWNCTCGTRWACPLHDDLPADTPDWHPGMVRVGYWD